MRLKTVCALALFLTTPAVAQNWLGIAREQTEQAFAKPAVPAFELPDLTLTPGQVDPRLTASDVCNGQGTRSRRNVTAATRAKVLRDYSTAAADSYEFEIDHLVPLCLGGTNAAANIWPQPEKESLLKDRLERRLCEMVCAGQLPLARAQHDMAEDWSTAYSKYVGERQATSTAAALPHPLAGPAASSH